MIQKRDAPLGTHVAIGPFDQRAQASRWSSQLQSEGLNARVYFGE
jgi:cell division protein FtsN